MPEESITAMATSDNSFTLKFTQALIAQLSFSESLAPVAIVYVPTKRILSNNESC